MRDMDLGEMAVELRGGDVEALAGDDAAFVERVFVRVAQGDELVVLLKAGASGAGPAQGVLRGPRAQASSGTSSFKRRAETAL